MREPSRLARPSVNGDADIDDVSDLAEEVVEFAVGHVEGHVPDEEGAGWLRNTIVAGAKGRLAAYGGELDGEAAAFERLVVVVVDGALGGGYVGEVYVGEAVWYQR